MPLGFGGQFLARPARVCRRFCMTHIHRPIQRQGYFVKHRPEEKLIASPDPEYRIKCAARLQPFPICIAPEGPLAIAAFGYEPEILKICHFVRIDSKRRNEEIVLLEFVVPAEDPIVSPQSKSRNAGGNSDHLRANLWCARRRRALAIAFKVQR